MNWKYRLSDIAMSATEEQVVMEVLASKWLSCGPVTARFEDEAAAYLGVRQTTAVSSGTAALHLALCGLGIGPGDEVIVPSLTFVATANAVLYTGATPVFADIVGAQAPLICPLDIKDKITDRTRAIIVMHYGGYACDMPRIQALATAHGLFIVEDAAHAIGSRQNGRMLGTVGDVGCFSFFANKNLATGEGGLVVARSPDVAERIRNLRRHGMSSVTWDRENGHAFSYDVTALGYNYRTTEIQSALASVQLSKLERSNRRRREIVLRYRSNLRTNPYLSIPFDGIDDALAYHLFSVVLDEKHDRDAFMAGLKHRGVQTSIHYPPVHLFSHYKQLGYHAGMHPRTEMLASHLVTLPLHPLLLDDDVDAICEAIGDELACSVGESWRTGVI